MFPTNSCCFTLMWNYVTSMIYFFAWWSEVFPAELYAVTVNLCSAVRTKPAPQRTDISVSFHWSCHSQHLCLFSLFLKNNFFPHCISVLSVWKNLSNVVNITGSHMICVAQFSLLKYSYWIAASILFKCVTPFVFVCHFWINVKGWFLYSLFLRDNVSYLDVVQCNTVTKEALTVQPSNHFVWC